MTNEESVFLAAKIAIEREADAKKEIEKEALKKKKSLINSYKKKLKSDKP